MADLGLSAIATGIGAIASVAGTVVGMQGAQYQAESQANSMRYQALLQERQASEVQAASQREGLKRRREGELLISRQRAVAAASGAGATDDTVLQLMGDAEVATSQNERGALYEGLARGQDLRDAAKNNRIGAGNALRAGDIQSTGILISGISSMASKFSGGGFKMPTATTSDQAMTEEERRRLGYSYG